MQFVQIAEEPKSIPTQISSVALPVQLVSTCITISSFYISFEFDLEFEYISKSHNILVVIRLGTIQPGNTMSGNTRLGKIGSGNTGPGDICPPGGSGNTGPGDICPSGQAFQVRNGAKT